MTDRASNTFPVLAHGLVAGAIWLLTSLRSGRRQHKQWRWRPPTKDTFCKYRKCNYSRLFIPMSGNGGWELELATTPAAGTLMAPTDTAAKVERSLMLTLPLNFHCIAANWLIDSSFFSSCGARTAALNGCVSTWLWTHTRAEWLDGCRAAKQLSTVNTLAGLSTIQLLLSLFCIDVAMYATLGSLFIRAVCKFSCRQHIGEVCETPQTCSHFPVGFGHTSVFVRELCCQSCTETSLIQVFPGTRLRECLQGVGLTS